MDLPDEKKLDKEDIMAHWLLPANTKFYDVVGAFNQSSTYWPMKAKLKAGDILFIYLSAPQKQIAYTCKVTKIDLPLEVVFDSICEFAKDSIDKKKPTKPFAKLSNIVSLPIDEQSFLGYQYLKENGLNGMLMGPRKLENNPPLLKYIQERIT